MRAKLLAGLALLVTSGVTIAEPLFAVKSNDTGLNIPITLCLDGKKKAQCQNYKVKGTSIEVQTRTKSPTSYKNAGIVVNAPRYTVIGCVPYDNGYCIFAVNNFSWIYLDLTHALRKDTLSNQCP